MAADPRSPRFGRERGFALLLVLWTLVLLAFIIGHVGAVGRTEVRIAGNLAANATAQAAADGAVYQAIFAMTDPRPEQRWLADGGSHELAIGRSQVTLRIDSEAGHINPNLASPALLQAMLRLAGAEPAQAATLAGAILDWVGTAQPQRQPAQLQAEYAAAGLNYAPPGAPVESLDELGRVRGMPPAVLAALLPHLSLFAPAEPDPAAADPFVAAALVAAQNIARGGGAVAGQAAPAGTLVTARIQAVARGPGNAVVGRVAVVRVNPVAGRDYALLSWETGRE